MIGWLLLSLYVIGYFVTWFLLTRKWHSEFGTNGSDFWGGAVWGAFGAIFWPLIIPTLGMAYVARSRT